MIVAFCGYAGSGKDTAADILVKDYGFTKIAFADALRKMAWDINPMVWVDVYGKRYYYQQVINDYGYSGAKEIFPEVRRFLQRLGTDGCRRHIDDNIWVDLVLDKIRQNPKTNYAISDLRFPNEAIAIQEWRRDDWKQGIVIRLRRGSLASDHPSEVGVDSVEWDIEIDNSGTLEELRDTIHFCMGRLLL